MIAPLRWRGSVFLSSRSGAQWRASSTLENAVDDSSRPWSYPASGPLACFPLLAKAASEGCAWEILPAHSDLAPHKIPQPMDRQSPQSSKAIRRALPDAEIKSCQESRHSDLRSSDCGTTLR